MSDTPTPETIVKSAIEQVAEKMWCACSVHEDILALASDQAEVAQIIQNAGGKTDPYLYAVGYDVGFKEAQGRVEAKLKEAMEMALDGCPYRYGTDSYNEWWNNFRTILAAMSETHKLKGDSDG